MQRIVELSDLSHAIMTLLPSSSDEHGVVGYTVSQILEKLRNSQFDFGKTVDPRYQRRNVERTLVNLLQKPLSNVKTSENGSSRLKKYWVVHKFSHTPLLELSGQICAMDSLILRYLPASTQSKISKLSSTQNRQNDWSNKLFLAPSSIWLRPQWNSEVVAKVYHAVQQEFYVQISYTKADRTKITAELFPLGLMFKGELIYLVARRKGDPKLKTLVYALHRIAAASIKETVGFSCPERLQRGQSFQQLCRSTHLHLFASNTTSEDLIKIELRFFGYRGSQLAETPLSEDQEIEDVSDGRVLRATVLNCDELYKFVLSYGSDVEVLAPEKVRTKMQEIIQQTAKLYAKPIN